MAKNKKRDLSITSRSLKVKLAIAFYLSSVIPLLGIIVYVIRYHEGFFVGYMSLIFLIVIVISITGFLLMRRMIFPVIEVADKAKAIARGETDISLDIKSEDEIGDL